MVDVRTLCTVNDLIVSCLSHSPQHATASVGNVKLY